MHRTWLAAAAILGAIGVMLGAFGAHGLEKLTADESILKTYDTAARDQLIHAVALMGVAILAIHNPSRLVKWAAIFFIAGIILFSGSLYLISYLKIREVNVKMLGPVTPAGGMLLILGWVLLLFAALRRNRDVKVQG